MPESPAIHVIDHHYLGVPQTIASYLVRGPEGPVLIEAGPASTFAQLAAGINELGFAISDVRDVLLTHIHLDHAGAAGHLAARGARVYVHEFGAPHLIDPSKLLSSAKRIYGDQMDRLWGETIAVPSDQVVPLHDGDVIDAGGLRFTAIDTPGHARHHCCFALNMPRRPVCFTGDLAAMIVPGIPGTKFINLPTPPPEFHLEYWTASVRRIEAHRFGSLFLTHFGEVRTPDSHLLAVRQALRAHVEYIRSSLRAGHDESAIVDRYSTWVLRQASEAGVAPEKILHFVSENLLRMNVSGMIRYWTREMGIGTG